MDAKIIHNQRLAGWLMLSGHKLVRTNPNKDRPQYNVFVFNASESLERCITEYLSKYQKT